MRTIPFRDVLWGVAYKLGLDPDQSNFLTNQGVPIGTYINEWVRRTYDARDWPEWVVTQIFEPGTDHIVPYDPAAIIGPVGTVLPHLGRILKVFLIDPNTTSAPVATPFTLLEHGIHVGFDHGVAVWVRYMMPAPQFTAVMWDPTATYHQNDITYSYRTGEVYRSKANGNLGHDPASNFALPPAPIVEVQPVPPPLVDVVQPLVFSNAGLTAQNEILVIDFNNFTPPGFLADPPPANVTYYVEVYNIATAAVIASATHVSTGAESLATIITGLRATLVADPDLAAYVITVDATAKTMTLSSPSAFQCTNSNWRQLSVGLTTHYFRTTVTQTYVPSTLGAAGQPKVTQITITDATTYPGATYSIVIIDSTGLEHSVEYVSNLYDGSAQILAGLTAAIDTATDPYFEGVNVLFNPTGITMSLGINENASVDVHVELAGSAWWELVPFPRKLSEQVMRGAYADLLKEWGQSDKGAAEEGVVPQEAQISEGDFTTTPNPPLTGQQGALSRYKI